jgi:4-hydroxy-tetrahydrodipicolinate reductase
MGQAVCRALLAAGDLELVAAVARSTGVGHPLRELVPEAPEDLLVGESLSDLVAAEAEVVVDFSRPEATMAAIDGLLPDGVHLVSGTTGLPAAALDQLAALAGKADHGNAVWAPNFALGAVLATHFATIAARWYPAAEVIELHHQGKVDAPSGTAIRTANAIAAARGPEGSGEPQGGAPDGRAEPAGVPAAKESVAGVRGGEVGGVRVHSVRLPGLVAHQEVLFGGQGEVLTLRHDSLERSSFMPGVLLAVREVTTRTGLTVGLEPLLGLA